MQDEYKPFVAEAVEAAGAAAGPEEDPDSGYAAYCDAVERTTAWGGQVRSPRQNLSAVVGPRIDSK